MKQPITLEGVAKNLARHEARCAEQSRKTNETLVELAGKLKPIDDVREWWGHFKHWVWSVAGAVVLTILAGTIGSFWNGYQSSQAAAKAAAVAQVAKAATPSPAEDAQRTAREQKILDQLDAIKKQVSN